MAVRLTQQILLTGFTSDPVVRVTALGAEAIAHYPAAARATALGVETIGHYPAAARATSMAVEVIRSYASVSAGSNQPQQFIICSG